MSLHSRGITSNCSVHLVVDGLDRGPGVGCPTDRECRVGELAERRDGEQVVGVLAAGGVGVDHVRVGNGVLAGSDVGGVAKRC